MSKVIFNAKAATLAIFLMPGMAQAACSLASGASIGTVNFTLPAMTTTLNPSSTGTQEIARTAISTSELASAMNLPSATSNIWSDSTASSLVWTPLRDTASGLRSPVASGYIKTGIDNLYMYLYGDASLITYFSTPMQDGSEYTRAMSSIGTSTWTTLGNATLVLYQTGPIRKGGIVPGGALATLKLSDGGSIMHMTMDPFTVNVLGCEITTPAVSVVMDRSTIVGSFSGAGSTAGETPFAIEANCDSGLLPTLTFDGVTEGSDDSIFAFTNKGEDGAASGLGVQIKYKGSAINNNVPVNLEQTQNNGATTFPFTANYIQTGDTIGAGSVSTSMTYTLSYQ